MFRILVLLILILAHLGIMIYYIGFSTDILGTLLGSFAWGWLMSDCISKLRKILKAHRLKKPNYEPHPVLVSTLKHKINKSNDHAYQCPVCYAWGTQYVIFNVNSQITEYRCNCCKKVAATYARKKD